MRFRSFIQRHVTSVKCSEEMNRRGQRVYQSNFVARGVFLLSKLLPYKYTLLLSGTVKLAMETFIFFKVNSIF